MSCKRKIFLLLIVMGSSSSSAAIPDLNHSTAHTIRTVFRKHGWSAAAAERLIFNRERLGYFEDMAQLEYLPGISPKLSAKLGIVFRIGKNLPRNTVPLLLKIKKIGSPEEQKLYNTDELPVVNINTADAEKLASLPGIGFRLAKRIIQYRNKNGIFKKRWEILRFKNITPDLYALIRGKIRAGEAKKSTIFSLSCRAGGDSEKKSGVESGGRIFFKLPNIMSLRLLIRSATNNSHFKNACTGRFIRGLLTIGSETGRFMMKMGDYRLNLHPAVNGSFTADSRSVQPYLFRLKPPGYSRLQPHTRGWAAHLDTGIIKAAGFSSSTALKELLKPGMENREYNPPGAGLTASLHGQTALQFHTGLLLFNRSDPLTLVHCAFRIDRKMAATVIGSTIRFQNGTRPTGLLFASTRIGLPRSSFKIDLFQSARNYSCITTNNWGNSRLPGRGVFLRWEHRFNRWAAIGCGFNVATEYNRERTEREATMESSLKLLPGTSVRLNCRWENKNGIDAEIPASVDLTLMLSSAVADVFSIHAAIRHIRCNGSTGNRRAVMIKAGRKCTISLRVDAGIPADRRSPLYIPVPPIGDWYTGGRFFRKSFTCFSCNIRLHTGRLFKADLRLFRSSESGEKSTTGFHVNFSMNI